MSSIISVNIQKSGQWKKKKTKEKKKVVSDQILHKNSDLVLIICLGITTVNNQLTDSFERKLFGRVTCQFSFMLEY